MLCLRSSEIAGPSTSGLVSLRRVLSRPRPRWSGPCGIPLPALRCGTQRGFQMLVVFPTTASCGMCVCPEIRNFAPISRTSPGSSLMKYRFTGASTFAVSGYIGWSASSVGGQDMVGISEYRRHTRIWRSSWRTAPAVSLRGLVELETPQLLTEPVWEFAGLIRSIHFTAIGLENGVYTIGPANPTLQTADLRRMIAFVVMRAPRRRHGFVRSRHALTPNAFGLMTRCSPRQR